MNIVLFGATGRVGMSVIEYALAADQHVIAVARNRAKIQQTHSHLTVVEGDLYTLPSWIDMLPRDIDAVINVVGGDVFKPSTLVMDSVQAAFTMMKQLGVQRYLGITGVAEMQACGFFGTITGAVMRRSPIRHAVSDHDKAFALVKASDTDWTLAGCPYIRDGKHTASYKVVPECFPGGFKIISPQDVADFLVKEVQTPHFHKQVVGIWN